MGYPGKFQLVMIRGGNYILGLENDSSGFQSICDVFFFKEIMAKMLAFDKCNCKYLDDIIFSILLKCSIVIQN